MATYVAANATSSAVQDAIDLASHGDTVEIPAGIETWIGSLSSGEALISTDKAIHIKGAGIGQTNLTNGLTGSRVHLIRIANHATLNSRISGISVLGLTDLLRGFRVSHTVAGGVGWRIHDCDFTGSGNCNAINVYGLGKGLIDNCQFTGGGAAEMIHNFGDGTVAFGAGTAQGWLVDISPGSDDAVYIEDCTFSNTITTGLYVGCSALQSYYGARTVLRHCQLNF